MRTVVLVLPVKAFSMNKVLKNKIKQVSRISADTFILPKFSLRVHKLLFDQFPKTFIVGGAVRNMLLNVKITDTDIATEATPDQVVKLLKTARIKYSDAYKNLGVIVALKGAQKIEISTFRKEVYSKSRFPKVAFITSPKADSNRRDFTVNALYYNPITKEILDYHNGLKDLQNKSLKFIGPAEKKITEDPLRIIRAYRFSLQYNLQISTDTQSTLNKNKVLINLISKTRVEKEINTVKQKNLQNKLLKVIHSNT